MKDRTRTSASALRSAPRRYFQKNVHYVDPLKMAIMGWSYGGFVASSAIGRDEDHQLFQCGIAVAPVTDWSYYGKATITETITNDITNAIIKAITKANALFWQRPRSVGDDDR